MNWQSPKLAGLTDDQWRDLSRRVGNGLATADDAEPVEQIGLMDQAIKIRQGTADYTDSMHIHLQSQMRLHDLIDVEKSGTGQRRVAG